MNVSTPVPDVGTPVFDNNGYINPVWHSFFFTLLQRTGGGDGVDAAAESRRTTQNMVRISEAESSTASMVDSGRPFVPTAPSAEVYTHGLHADPALHALVTPQFAGFMSPEDKAKLDALGLYEAGTWSPALTFATPGDLAVAYSEQIGTYVRFGSMVIINFQITTSVFTYTSASGALLLTGTPIPNAGPQYFAGTLSFEGLTRAGYTQFTPTLFPAGSTIAIVACGSGLGRNVSDTNTTTSGTNVSLIGTITYYV